MASTLMDLAPDLTKDQSVPATKGDFVDLTEAIEARLAVIARRFSQEESK